MNKTQTEVMDIGSAKSENQLKRTSFISLFWQVLDKSFETIARNCSAHGWNWYLKANKVWKKVLVIVPLHVLFVYVCYECSVRFYDLYDSLENVSASQKKSSSSNTPIPNLLFVTQVSSTENF